VTASNAACTLRFNVCRLVPTPPPKDPEPGPDAPVGGFVKLIGVLSDGKPRGSIAEQGPKAAGRVSGSGTRYGLGAGQRTQVYRYPAFFFSSPHAVRCRIRARVLFRRAACRDGLGQTGCTGLGCMSRDTDGLGQVTHALWLLWIPDGEGKAGAPFGSGCLASGSWLSVPSRTKPKGEVV
jgi:hypothetical protein